MATIWDLTKRSYQKRKQREVEAQRRTNPLDAGFPFGIHDEGKVRLSPVSLLIPDSGLSFQPPGEVQIVQATGQGTILGKRFFRALLHPEEDGNPSYLLIIEHEGKFQIRWFHQVDEIFPDSADGWAFWLAKKDGYIGLPQFQTKDGVLYNRLWDESKKRIEPVTYKETVYSDRYDTAQIFRLEHACMLYGRTIKKADCEELLLVSHTKGPEGESIVIDVGIDLSAVELEVVY